MEVLWSTKRSLQAMIKALVWHPDTTPEGQHLLDSRVGFFVSGAADSKEGVTSFLEKVRSNARQ